MLKKLVIRFRRHASSPAGEDRRAGGAEHLSGGIRCAAWIAAILGMLSGTGCGPEAENPPAAASAAVPQPATGKAMRVVSLSPSITEVLFALGLDKEIVGVTRYCDYPKEATTKSKVGGYYDPSYEAILALEPDLVILIVQHEEAVRKLSAVGIRTVTVDDSRVEGILDGIQTIGQVCGRETNAAAIVSDLKARMGAIRKRTAGKAKPSVLLCISRAMGTGGLKDVYVAGLDGFYSVLLEKAGGETAYRRDTPKFPMLSREGILELNPDVIIDLAADLDRTKYSVNDVMAEWKAVAGVNAVRKGRVHVLVEDYITVPGPRFILLLEQLARILHPEIDWEQ